MKTTLALFGKGFRGFTLALPKETIFPWGGDSSVNPVSLRLFDALASQLSTLQAWGGGQQF